MTGVTAQTRKAVCYTSSEEDLWEGAPNFGTQH